MRSSRKPKQTTAKQLASPRQVAVGSITRPARCLGDNRHNHAGGQQSAWESGSHSRGQRKDERRLAWKSYRIHFGKTSHVSATITRWMSGGDHLRLSARSVPSSTKVCFRKGPARWNAGERLGRVLRRLQSFVKLRAWPESIVCLFHGLPPSTTHAKPNCWPAWRPRILPFGSGHANFAARCGSAGRDHRSFYVTPCAIKFPGLFPRGARMRSRPAGSFSLLPQFSRASRKKIHAASSKPTAQVRAGHAPLKLDRLGDLMAGLPWAQRWFMSVNARRRFLPMRCRFDEQLRQIAASRRFMKAPGPVLHRAPARQSLG